MLFRFGNLEAVLAPPAGQNSIFVMGDPNGAFSAGSYFLFIWNGLDKWYTLGKLRSQGTGQGVMGFWGISNNIQYSIIFTIYT